MTAPPPLSVPIIVTALMGAEDFAKADAMRRQHFLPERNQIPAHISLFHHLPPARLAELTRLMAQLTRGEMAPAARLAGVMSLGRGVAYRIESPELMALRERIAEVFAADLIAQDQPPPRLHITVQNKVAPRVAAVLHSQLNAEFRPRRLVIAGIAAWHYLGGPWQLAHRALFTRSRA